MESIISTFHIDLKIILAQLFNFGVVFVVLYIYALKPLNKIMKERSEKIEKGVKDAKTNAEILKNTKEEYDKIVAQAKNEADKIFKDGKKEAEEKRALMLEKAKEEVATLIEGGKKSLENEKRKIVEEAKNEIVSLSVKIAEKILGEKIGSSFDERKIKELENL